MPNIGITSCGSPNAAYTNAVVRAGGEVVFLPNDVRRVGELLAALDGVIIGGGVDVDPARYGGNPDHSRAQRGEYRADRDEFEIALVRAVRELRVPTLCICRGLQIANVALGGTLIEDLSDELGERYVIEHRQTDEAGVERYDYAAEHTVAVRADSAFARFLAKTSFPVNSMHHQAVARVGDGLAAVGHTSDGVIEVLDARFAHPFFYAVQWHPEELADSISGALFGGLVAAARQAAISQKR